MNFKLGLTLLAFCLALTVDAQTTSFTYQGRLGSNGSPANGMYDFRFRLLDDGTQVIAGPITNATVWVTNGLFTTALDFGSTNFNGDARTLEIAVRSFGSPVVYTVLSPNQPISALPYAIQALKAATADRLTTPLAATNLSGTIADVLLSTNLARLNSNVTFQDTVTASNFTGSAVGLTGIQASSIAPNSGPVPNVVLFQSGVLTNNFGGIAASNTTFVGSGSDANGWYHKGPVPFFAPSANNPYQALDLMPSGYTYLNNPGATWLDLCASDIRLDSNNWQVATLWCSTNYVNVGAKSSGTAPVLPTIIAAIDFHGTGGAVGINYLPDQQFSVIGGSVNALGASIENTNRSSPTALTRLLIGNVYNDPGNGLTLDSFPSSYVTNGAFTPMSTAIFPNTEMTNGLILLTRTIGAPINLYAGGIVSNNLAVQILSNAVSIFPPVKANAISAAKGYTSPQTTAAKFDWTVIPASTATTTNWWWGGFTNGQFTAIASNFVTGLYIIKQLAP